MKDETPPNVLEELKNQLEAERVANWSKLKPTLDTLDDYDFIEFWYELEIIDAWYSYYVFNDSIKTKMERRCKTIISKGTDDMIGGVSYRLALKSILQNPEKSRKDFFKMICALRNNAYIHGTCLGMRMRQPMFSTYNLRLMTDIRKELVHRFENSRALVAKPTS